MKGVQPFERFADIGGLKENRQCAMLIYKVKKGLLNETVLSGWLEFASTEVITNMREGDTDDTEIICIIIVCNVYKGMLANELNRIDKMGKCQFVDYIFLDKDANTIHTSNSKSMSVSNLIDVIGMGPSEFIKTFDDGEGFNGIISNGGKRSFILIIDFEDKDWMDAFIKFQTDKVSIYGNTVAVEYEDINRRKFMEFVNIAMKMDGVKI